MARALPAPRTGVGPTSRTTSGFVLPAPEAAEVQTSEVAGTPMPAAGGTGSAAMRLTPQSGDRTTLQVEVAVEVSGVVAQFSGPLIDIAARQMAALFFERFREGAVARHADTAIP